MIDSRIRFGGCVVFAGLVLVTAGCGKVTPTPPPTPRPKPADLVLGQNPTSAVFCDIEISRRCSTKEEKGRVDKGETTGGIKININPVDPSKSSVGLDLGGKSTVEDTTKTTTECPVGKDTVIYDCDALAGCSLCVDDSLASGVIGANRRYENYEAFCEAFCEVRAWELGHPIEFNCGFAARVNQQRMRETNVNACNPQTAVISPDWVDPIKRTMEKTSGTMMSLTASGGAAMSLTSPSFEGAISGSASVVRTRVELSPRTGLFINDVDTPRTRRVLEHLDMDLNTTFGELGVDASSVSLIGPVILDTTSDGSVRIRRQDALFAVSGVVGGQRFHNIGSPSQDIVGKLNSSGQLTLEVRSVQDFVSLLPGTSFQGTADVSIRVDTTLVPDSDGDGIPDAQEICPNGSTTDVTPPVFTFVPPAVTADRCAGVSIGTAQAKDPCGITIVNDAPTVFRLGTTTVTWFARDERGNTATATQQVTTVLGSDPLCCPNNANVIVGTSNNDVLTGTNGVDCIIGLGGQDTITGGAGDDLLSGGDGDDRIFGGEGNDRIAGGSGQDQLFGGAGNDDMSGGDGDDVCQGEIGHDTISGGQGQDNLSGGDGNDRLSGNDGDDLLQSGPGVDTLDGGGIHDRCIGNSATTFLRCERIQR